MLANPHQVSDVEFLRFEHHANGNTIVMTGNAQRSYALEETFTVPGRTCLRMKATSSFASLLREQGYSENAITEICRWYIWSTTSKSSEKLADSPKN